MRLREVVELPEFKKRDIVVIGHYNTDEIVFAVLARRGEKVLPVPKLFYLIEDGPENPDPEIDKSVINSILRHFGYFEPISTFPPK
jgi:hypothetical protein